MSPPLESGPTARKARIEIIPLIDVVFFLLATFVLFTLALEKIEAHKLSLPQSDHAPQIEDDTVFVQASAGETYTWKVGRAGTAEIVSVAELYPRFSERAARNPGLRVMISGDLTATFGTTVRAPDEARRARIEHVTIDTTAAAMAR
jgi:biopolymer transport protein ExbD